MIILSVCSMEKILERYERYSYAERALFLNEPDAQVHQPFRFKGFHEIMFTDLLLDSEYTG